MTDLAFVAYAPNLAGRIVAVELMLMRHTANGGLHGSCTRALMEWRKAGYRIYVEPAVCARLGQRWMLQSRQAVAA